PGRSCAKHVTLIVDASRQFYEPQGTACWDVIRTKTYDVVQTGIQTQHCHYTPHQPSRGAYWGWDEITTATRQPWPGECKKGVEKLTGKTNTPGIYYYGLDPNGGWLMTFGDAGVHYRLVELYGTSHVLNGAAERRWMSMDHKQYGAILAITSPDESEATIVNSFRRLCKNTPGSGAIGWWAGPGSEYITPTSALFKQLVSALDGCTEKR